MYLPVLSPERARIVAHYPAPRELALQPTSVDAWRWRQVGLIGAAAGLAAFASAGSLPAAIGGVVLLGALVGRRVWLMRRVHVWIRESDEAVAVLNAGDPATALAQFEALAARTRAHPLLHALIVYNASVAWLGLGEIDRALSLLGAAESSHWMDHPRSPYRGQMLVTSAWALTLRGELTLAENRLQRARHELAGSRAGMLVAAEVAFLLRTGRPRQAEEYAAAHWHLAEAIAPVLNLRRVYALRGFAVSQAPTSPERDTAVARFSALASPYPDGWHTAMAGYWPELRVWLDEVGLGR